MKLLIITQKVDKSDPILGFFHRWIEEFAKRFEFVTVICLEGGLYHLPINVKVLSLGKEMHVSKVRYIVHFYKYVWNERNNYDVVFVHMNQEYVLLGWIVWQLLGKKIYLWRNHAKGSLLTWFAVMMSGKVFCTSPQSFTAKFKKTVIMPVGIDTDFFKPDSTLSRTPNSVLFLGRISPVKKVIEFIDWVKDKQYSVTIAGPILAENRDYGEKVKRNLTNGMKYIGPVTQDEALKLYQSHEIYVNKTPSGSMDKTIFEALSCGMRLIVDNLDAQNIKIEDHSLKTLMDKLIKEL